MTELDTQAIDLCQSYQSAGVACFVIRSTEGNNLRVIGLQLPPDVVATMLRSAADAYESAAPYQVRN